MLKVEVDARNAVGKLNRISILARANVRETIYELTHELADLVRRKLSGEVLQVRTGALRGSIDADVSSDGYTGRVYSDGSVPYAAIHEYGGVTSPHPIYPVNAKALAFELGGELRFFAMVNHPGSVIPERSYLRSSLADMAEEITQRLNQAVADAAAEGGV